MQLNKIYWLKLSGHRPKHIPVINKYIGQITKWLPWDPWLMCHFESMQFHSVTCSCYWTCSSIYLSKFPTKPLLLFVFLQLSFQGTKIKSSNHDYSCVIKTQWCLLSESQAEDANWLLLWLFSSLAKSQIHCRHFKWYWCVHWLFGMWSKSSL